MRFATSIAPLRSPAGRILAVIALVLIPFPVSIPLLLWVTGRLHVSGRPDLPRRLHGLPEEIPERAAKV